MGSDGTPGEDRAPLAAIRLDEYMRRKYPHMMLHDREDVRSGSEDKASRVATPSAGERLPLAPSDKESTHDAGTVRSILSCSVAATEQPYGEGIEEEDTPERSTYDPVTGRRQSSEEYLGRWERHAGIPDKTKGFSRAHGGFEIFGLTQPLVWPDTIIREDFTCELWGETT
jgi:hypothetical protein